MPPTQLLPFDDNSQIKFRGKGVEFSAAANASSTYDYDIEFDCLINGLELVCSSQLGDNITVKVVDKTNVMGFGAGAVLDTFADKWRMREGSADVRLNYAAKLVVGFSLRLVYENKSILTTKQIYANLYLHKLNPPA